MRKIILILMLFACTVTFAAAKEAGTSVPANFSMGSWNGNVYTNDFLGLKFTLPEGWTRYSDEQIAAAMNLSNEKLNDQKSLVELAKLTVVNYMFVNNPTTGETIVVTTEKAHLDVTTEFYLDNIKTQLEALTSVSYKVSGITKETIADREYHVLTAALTSSGKTVIQKYYCCRLDKHFLSIMVVSPKGKKAAGELIKAFE